MYQGTVKQVINFSEAEGQPACLDVCGNYLLIGTETGVLKVYDLSRRYHHRLLTDLDHLFLNITKSVLSTHKYENQT